MINLLAGRLSLWLAVLQQGDEMAVDHSALQVSYSGVRRIATRLQVVVVVSMQVGWWVSGEAGEWRVCKPVGMHPGG